MLSGALVGLAFETKMLQAFVVLPAFGLVYLWAGPPKLGRRIGQLLAGGAALLVSAGWWVAAVAFQALKEIEYFFEERRASVAARRLVGLDAAGRPYERVNLLSRIDANGESLTDVDSVISLFYSASPHQRISAR